MKKYINPEILFDRISCNNDICISAEGSVPDGGKENGEDNGNLI